MLRSCLFLTVLLVAAHASAGLAAAPVLIDKVMTSEDDRLEIVISNSGSAPLRIELGVSPLSHDRRGAPVAGVAGAAHDLSTAIHFDTPSFVLPARRWKRIHARVDAPGNATAGYAMILARGLEVEPAAGSSGVITALQVGIVVELSFPGAPAPAFRAEEVVLEGTAARVLVRNDGVRHGRAGGVVRLVDGAGVERWRSHLVPANVFPSHVRELEVAGRPASLAAGAYELVIEVDGATPHRLSRPVTVAAGQLDPVAIEPR